MSGRAGGNANRRNRHAQNVFTQIKNLWDWNEPWIFGPNINASRREGGLWKLEGTVFRHCRCELCRRDFIEETQSGELCAVNVSAFDFIRLAREVSDRWLNEPCPKKPMPSDALDRLELA